MNLAACARHGSGLLTATAVAVSGLLVLTMPTSAQPFAIRVVDEATGRGVPLVDLETINHIHYVTDSSGLVAFDEPGLLGRRVFFTVTSHGYEYPKDGFGYRGLALDTQPGGEATIRIRRLNIAERLYRLTGAGIYRDSVLLGVLAPVKQPLLNGLVLGQDTVLTAVYHGRLYWFWGDTNRPSYPLGNFHTPGATSLLPDTGGLSPDVGVDLEYFVDADGFAKETAHLPGDGPTWLGGLTVLRDEAGIERMFAAYAKVRHDMSAHNRGIVEWDDRAHEFRKVADFGGEEPAAMLCGHTFQLATEGPPYVYCATPYPLVRVPARPEALVDRSQYEAFTCLKPGTRDPNELDRAEDGTLRWAWKRDTKPLEPQQQTDLIKAGKMREEEALLQLRDADTGKPVRAASGSVYPNAYRRRWVMIASEAWGTSMLGEVWYAEGDTPLGPWVYARKVVTHDRYSFYNPLHHPMFDQDGGRLIYFEGTYVTTFSGNTNPTPRYDYNQIMYRLDLSDPRLALPVPVYSVPASDGGPGFATLHDLPETAKKKPIAFFARDRAVAGDVAIYRGIAGSLQAQPVNVPYDGPAPLFYALPADLADPPATSAILYERAGPAGVTHSVDRPKEGEEVRAVCRVWRNPMVPTVLAESGF